MIYNLNENVELEESNNPINELREAAITVLEYCEYLEESAKSDRKAIIKKSKKALDKFFNDFGITDTSLSTTGAKGLGDFKKGKENDLRFFLSSFSYDMGQTTISHLNQIRNLCASAISQNKNDLIERLKTATLTNVSNVYTEKGALNWFYIVIKFDF